MNLLDSYHTYFRDLHPILRDMAARGIPIDNGRREELRALIERESITVDTSIRALVPPEVLTTKQKNGYKNPPILKCEECDYGGRGDHICVDLRPVPYAEMAEAEGLVQREIVIGEEEKCRCSKKSRPDCVLCAGMGFIPVGTVELRWAEPKEFNPNSPPQVRKFIRFLGHPVPKHQKRVDSQGEAAETTEMKELERLANSTKHPIYRLLIQKRQLTKVFGTYYEGWKPWSDGCVHTTYTFNTSTWQTSSKAPNVQNGLKHGKDSFQKSLATAFNGMQTAKPGCVLVNFDFKSFHALTTAHDFNIPDYARLARIDIHSFLTCHYLRQTVAGLLWAMKDEDMLDYFEHWKKDEKFKFTRDFKAKRTILGIQFGMGFRKLYQLNRDDFENESEAKRLWEMVYSLFPRLRIAQEEVKCIASQYDPTFNLKGTGQLVSQYGAIRHFYDVRRWDRKQQKWIGGDQAEEAVAFLPASHAFGFFRETLLRIRKLGLDEKYGLCNQIHDSMLFHCRRELAEECVAVVKPIMETPSDVLRYEGMAPGGFQCGAEAAVGESLAECK